VTVAARHGIARDRDGVTMIEFALLLPFFLILLFGIIQFAQAIFVLVALQHAVSLSARCASLFYQANSLGAQNTPPDCSSTANIQNFAVQQAYGLSVAAGTFTPSTAPSSPPAQFSCVAASYNFALGIPLIPNYTIVLKANSCCPINPANPAA
jgi:Flp pilus assembly protein TadG